MSHNLTEENQVLLKVWGGVGRGTREIEKLKRRDRRKDWQRQHAQEQGSLRLIYLFTAHQKAQGPPIIQKGIPGEGL